MTRMDWKKLLIAERFGAETIKSVDGRSQFQKDIDRITFSSSFRRLGRKTQVHPLNENDHIHTRLSHSLEVACVGRSLGIMLGNFLISIKALHEEITPSNIGEIVRAACLAHDIGNPPFGHGGEEVIKKWFGQAFEMSDIKNRITPKEREADFTCFDGNAMAFRIVTFKEYYTGDGGMRLTYPTIGAMLKYPWTSHFAGKKEKFGCFMSEFESLNHVANKLGLNCIEEVLDESKAKYVRHPLAFLVEAADDICYRILDIEDAVELGLLSLSFIEKEFKPLLNLKNHEEELLSASNVSRRTKNALLRGKTMELLIADVMQVFKDNYDEIMEGTFETGLTETRTKESCNVLNEAYKHVISDVYSSRRKTIIEIGAFSTIGNLLDTFSEAAFQICCLEQKRRSYKTRKISELLGSNIPFDVNTPNTKHLYHGLMLTLDYITGMTDQYATSINKKILGINM